MALLTSLLGVEQVVSLSASRVHFDTLEAVLDHELAHNPVIRKELLSKVRYTLGLLAADKHAGAKG